MLIVSRMSGLLECLLHLLRNTVFVEKSSIHVHICYLPYLNDLDSYIEYTWGGGVVVLVFLYD
ncbi:hypothetical protein GLYMA_18G177551v4 [Glycine max]|nr:hypothetical protein GLYMA_18G177551v4 [Glycine max]KAH1154967.1 hypothetical protein GYH30_050310 [Glycine max]